jgi:hypothetical protein
MDSDIPAWIPKAHRIIYALCEASWRTTNINPRTGRAYRTPRPYAVPQKARELVDALGQQDEERVKAIFLALNNNPAIGNDV